MVFYDYQVDQRGTKYGGTAIKPKMAANISSVTTSFGMLIT